MLLVDHGERQVAERHALLDQRVRPDRQVDRAIGDPLHDARSILARDGAGQERVRDGRVGRGRRRGIQERSLTVVLRRGPRQIEERHGADPVQERRHGSQVLPGEDLGRRHDRRLMAGLDRDERRVQRDERLPGSDVSLEQDVHRPGSPHRLADRVDRSLLRPGRLERQRPGEPLGQRARHRVRDAGLLGLHAMLAERDPELEREQLVELQPLLRAGELALILGEMDLPQRLVVVAEGFGLHQLGREWIGDRRQLLERRVDQLADRPRRDALRRRMHRRDARRVDQVGLIAAEELDLLVRELGTASIERDDAGDGHFLPDLVDGGEPRLVEERQIEPAGRVGERDDDHGLAAPRRPSEHLADRRDHGRIRTGSQVADRLHARAVDVAARVVVQQVAHRLDAHALEDLMRLQRFLRPRAGATLRQLGIDVEDLGVERERHGAFLIGDRFYHAVDGAPPLAHPPVVVPARRVALDRGDVRRLVGSPPTTATPVPPRRTRSPRRCSRPTSPSSPRSTSRRIRSC